MDSDGPPAIGKPPKFTKDGRPDGRGLSSGSRKSQFAVGDGRKRPGRRSGARSLKSIYTEIAALPVKVEIGGRSRTLSTPAAAMMKLRQKALNGDQKALDRLLALQDRFGPVDVEPELTAARMAEDDALLALAEARGMLPRMKQDKDDV